MELDTFVKARNAVADVISESHACITEILKYGDTSGALYTQYKNERAFMEDILISMDEFGKSSFGYDEYCNTVEVNRGA